MFFIFAFGIWFLGCSYTAWRLLAPLALGVGGKVLAVLCVLAFVFLPFLHWRFARRHEASRLTEISSWMAFLSMGALNYLCLLLLLRDILGLGVFLLSKLASVVYGQPVLTAALPAGAVSHLWQATNAMVLGLTGLIVSYGVSQARKKPNIRTVNVAIADLPEALTGLRIIQISDLHAGGTIRRAFIQKVVAHVQALQADLIAFTGDVADGTVGHLRPHVAALAELTARHGKFFVTGNHEYYSGVEPWVQEMRRLGFTVLLNENRELEIRGHKILVAGVTDYGAGHILAHHDSDPARALAHSGSCDLKILLAHQPRSIFAAAKNGCHLQLSGHTHGGQFLPWNWLVPLQQPYVAGLFQHEKTWLYVSRGTGYWGPPLRLGAPAEITLLTLAKA